MIFYTYIRTERLRTVVVISFVLNDIHTVRHRYPIAFVATRYLIDVSTRAVFFHTTSSKDRMSLLEVVWKTTAHKHKTTQYSFVGYKDKVYALLRMKIRSVSEE